MIQKVKIGKVFSNPVNPRLIKEDKFKKFNEDVAKLLQQHKDDTGTNGPLSEAQVTGAESAKEELSESKKECPLMTLETRNSILKKISSRNWCNLLKISLRCFN